MSETTGINVEVAYATPEKQSIIALTVAQGCSVKQAIEASGIVDQFPEIDPDTAAVGIFSRKAQLSDPLKEGDRIEIYRPLLADPKVIRREMAERKKEEAAARKLLKN